MGVTGDYRLGIETFTDEITGKSLPVEGEVPDWLEGHLVRNGPGKFEVGNRPFRHWFDCFALLRGFEIADGEVTYTARFLGSEAYEHAIEHDTLGYMEFGTNPEHSLPRRLFQALRGTLSDNAVVDVTRIGGELAAVTETERSVLLDPDTLAGRRTHTYDDDLSVLASVAHTHYDFDREETVGVGFQFAPRGRYRLYRRPRGTRRREEFATIPASRPSYMHSFALTERYVVLTEQPYDVNPLSLLTGEPFVENFQWRPEEGTRFLVVDRASGEVVATPETVPFFVFHHVNAYEEGGEIIVDLVAFEDDAAVENLYLDRVRDPEIPPPAGELRRYRLDLRAETVETERLHPGPIEFPMLNYRDHNTRPYRFVYGAGSPDIPPEGYFEQLWKIDVESGEATAWREPNTHPGEPVFVPAPDGEAEDDGVVLSVVLDTDVEQSFLVALDAASFEERARAWLPHALPFGFHGQFFDGSGAPKPSMA